MSFISDQQLSNFQLLFLTAYEEALCTNSTASLLEFVNLWQLSSEQERSSVIELFNYRVTIIRQHCSSFSFTNNWRDSMHELYQETGVYMY